jgi:Flp pilus assembly protein TadD
MQLFEQGRRSDAIVRLREAIRLDAGYAEAYKALGRAYLREGDSETGKRYLRRYLELRPNASDKIFVQGMLGDK